ncbi:MobF family relaxase [Acinetobacter ursingii]|uniref:MobF family relaxase n=1 Tax=Acinetobacter ursingii TaxID=108980 RepID=UPI003009A759
MISHSIITRSSAGSNSLGHIDSYYKDSKDDYYSKENQPSQWQGKLAHELGLSGEVKKEQFIDLMSGKDPRDYTNQLRQDKFNKKDANTRLAIDLTFSAPKSVSIESLVNANIDVMKAHELAVKKTLEKIEEFAETRKKTKGVTQIERTGKLAIGTFRHETNRNQDPHLHTHAVIINMTKRADGEYRALHNDSIVKNTKEYTKIYQAYLAKELKAQGFKLRITKDGFELAHINDNQIQAFSSRSKEVTDALEAKGLSRETATTADKQNATLDTRQRKQDKDIIQVRHSWKQIANEIGVVSFNPNNSMSTDNQINNKANKKVVGYNTFENAFNKVKDLNLSNSSNLLKSEKLNEQERSSGNSGFTAGFNRATGASEFTAGFSRATGASEFTAGFNRATGHEKERAGGSRVNQDEAFSSTQFRDDGKGGKAQADSNGGLGYSGRLYVGNGVAEEKDFAIKVSYSNIEQRHTGRGEDASNDMRAMPRFDVANNNKLSDVLLPTDQEIQFQYTRASQFAGLRGSGNSIPSNTGTGIDETLDDILDLDQVDLSLKKQWKKTVQELETGTNDEELFFNNKENLKEFVIKHLTDKDHVIKEKEIKEIIVTKGLGLIDYDEVDNLVDELINDGAIIKTQARYENKGVLYSEYAVRDMLGLYDDIDEKELNKIFKDNGYSVSDNIYTTQRAIDEDKYIINKLSESQGLYNPSYKKDEAQERLNSTTLNDEQKACALMVLSSDNSILGIQGYAGTGKSFMIARTKELIEDKGKEMVLFAPYSAQVKNLVDDGLEANTVAKFLVSKEIQENLNENSVIVIDESGVINSKQMADILKIRDQIGCQLVLLGDTAQTKAVEAGTPFELLQKNGMETTKMSDIQRQKNQVLRNAVVSSVTGDFDNAIDNLENLVEVKNTKQRHEILVDKYLSIKEEERDKTLIVSGTNKDRQSINDLIREKTGTQGAGIVFDKLSQKNKTKAEADYAISYNESEYVVFGRGNKRRKVESGVLYKVLDKDIKNNKLKLEDENGNQINVNPSGLQAGIFEKSNIELSVGDKVRVTKSYEEFKTGDLLTIESISKDTGVAVAKDADGKLVDVDLNKKHHLDYAYAMTVHASQGLTYDNVIVDLNTKSRTTSQETFYVGISRARHNAFVYTNSIDEMPESISRSATKHNAIELMDYGYKIEPDNYSNNQSDNGIILDNSNVYKGINVQFKNYINENEERLTVFEQIKFNHSKVSDENTKGAELLNFASDLADEKIKLESILIKDFNENKVDGLFAETSIGIVSLTKSAKEDGKWQVTQFYGKDNLPLSDSGNQDIERAVEDFIYAIDFSKLQLKQNVVKSNDEIKLKKDELLSLVDDDCQVKYNPKKSIEESDMSSGKATVKMVQNTITSLPNCEPFEDRGFYLKGNKEELHIKFGENRVDMWNKGDHVKAIEFDKPKDMKDSMREAGMAIKEIKSTLQELDNKALQAEKGLEAGQKPKEQSKQREDGGMEM